MAIITVVGCGRVGLVSAACLAELGHEVFCFEKSAEMVATLRKGKTPFHENHLPGLLARHRQRLHFIDDLAAAIGHSEVIFIAVGTPPGKNGEADICQMEMAARELGPYITTPKLIVEKSTVPVLTHERIARILELNGASRSNFEVAVNPEFLREGSAVTDWLYPERIVVGAASRSSAAQLVSLYQPLIDGTYQAGPDSIPPPPGSNCPPQVFVTTPSSAELIKYACNSFLAAKVSFIDAVANVCEQVGANIEEVCAGVGSDTRIGSQFLQPGIGFGGAGFATDVTAFERMVDDNGVRFTMLEEIQRINQDQRDRFIRKIKNALWTLRGKKLAVLGLAFKGGTDDIRESPAMYVVQRLLAESCSLIAYDPAAMDRAAEALKGTDVSFARSAYEAAKGCDAVIILTDWPEFRALDLDLLHQVLGYPIVIDGRNLFHPEEMVRHGLMYFSIGRPDAVPARGFASGSARQQT